MNAITTALALCKQPSRILLAPDLPDALADQLWRLAVEHQSPAVILACVGAPKVHPTSGGPRPLHVGDVEGVVRLVRTAEIALDYETGDIQTADADQAARRERRAALAALLGRKDTPPVTLDTRRRTG